MKPPCGMAGCREVSGTPLLEECSVPGHREAEEGSEEKNREGRNRNFPSTRSGSKQKNVLLKFSLF